MKENSLLCDLSAAVTQALTEDVGSGDLTAMLIPEVSSVKATVICRQEAVLCGVDWFNEVFRQLDQRILVQWQVNDGDLLSAGQLLCDLQGPARPLLTGERTALNFLQLLSGTATLARQYAKAVAGTGAALLDTRKTLPGLRRAQKYAVRCGGGQNHRQGLYDAILIKENHIMAAGSISRAIIDARRLYPGVTVEVEVEDLQGLEEALAVQPDMIMLDNFNLAMLRQAVVLVAGRVKLEASGNVALETLPAIAETGVDFISVGSLTKNVQAVDLSMRFSWD